MYKNSIENNCWLVMKDNVKETNQILIDWEEGLLANNLVIS